MLVTEVNHEYVRQNLLQLGEDSKLATDIGRFNQGLEWFFSVSTSEYHAIY
jgi:hypothetical protein